MNWQTIRTLVIKDLTLFFRNRFFALVSLLGLVAYTLLYFLMPRMVDETLELGLYAPELPPIIAAELKDEGIVIVEVDSEAALKAAMDEGDLDVGAVLPADFLSLLAAGNKAPLHLYFTSELPQELREAYVILFEEVAFLLSGQSLNIEATEEILGPDMVGAQIPLRNRMQPLFATFVLMVETMGLSTLLSSEIVGGTLQALLITPMRIVDLFVGKGISGVGLAFAQAAVLMVLTGGLAHQSLLMLVALLLGALLVTGIGFLIAAAGRDMMSVMAWGVLAVLLLTVPSLSVMFPGTGSHWLRLIPTYYLVDTVNRVANYGAVWGDVWANLAILLALGLAFVWLGIVALRRKLR